VAAVDWRTARGPPLCHVVGRRGDLGPHGGCRDPRLPYGRDVTHQLCFRSLYRNKADPGSARVGLVVAAAPPPAQAAAAAASSSLVSPLLGAVSFQVYTPRWAGRDTGARRAYLFRGGSGTIPHIGEHSGPPLAPLPLFTLEVSAQSGTPRLVSAAVWSGLERFLGDLPPILNNGVDQTLCRIKRRVTPAHRNR